MKRELPGTKEGMFLSLKNQKEDHMAVGSGSKFAGEQIGEWFDGIRMVCMWWWRVCGESGWSWAEPLSGLREFLVWFGSPKADAGGLGRKRNSSARWLHVSKFRFGAVCWPDTSLCSLCLLHFWLLSPSSICKPIHTPPAGHVISCSASLTSALPPNYCSHLSIAQQFCKWISE